MTQALGGHGHLAVFILMTLHSQKAEIKAITSPHSNRDGAWWRLTGSIYEMKVNPSFMLLQR